MTTVITIDRCSLSTVASRFMTQQHNSFIRCIIGIDYMALNLPNLYVARSWLVVNV